MTDHDHAAFLYETERLWNALEHQPLDRGYHRLVTEVFALRDAGLGHGYIASLRAEAQRTHDKGVGWAINAIRAIRKESAGITKEERA